MIIISAVFSLLLFITPPLILGTWIVLLLRFGLFGDLFRRTNLLIDPQKEPAIRSKSWMILTIIVFTILITLFVCLDIMLLMQKNESMETGILRESIYSLVATFLTLLYSPIFLILTLEAWLIVICYFGLHYILHRLKVPIYRIEQIKNFVVTVIQLLGFLTGFIGFGWWSNLEITNQSRFESLNNFLLVVLSPTTVLLTIGLVIMLFISLNKILVIEENVGLHKETAGRMTITLLSMLILLSLIGGSLSLLIHYDRSLWTI